MDEQILEIINKLKGSLLGIGLTNENILNAIEENSNIDVCYLLNNISLTGKKFSITKRGKNKKINIKKIKKQFKKKSLDNIIVGFAGIKIILDTAELMNIVTKKSFRANGIGKLMLEYLINMCKKEKIKTLNLEVNSQNTIAINLYKKYNFKEVGLRKKYYNNTYDAILMSLNF